MIPGILVLTFTVGETILKSGLCLKPEGRGCMTFSMMKVFCIMLDFRILWLTFDGESLWIMPDFRLFRLKIF